MMSKINEKEILRRFELISKFTLNPEVTACDLDRVRKKIVEGAGEQKISQQNIWIVIMKSRITQLTTAAVIIIAVIIGINQFGGPVDITTIAFADITEAMNNVPWMHIVSRGVERGLTGVGEQWFGFETKIEAEKDFDGEVDFWNVKEHKRYKYDPETRTITINYAYEDDVFFTSSPVSLLESMHKMVKEQGTEIITKNGKYNGQDVQIQEISPPVISQGKVYCTGCLYVEPESKLLYAGQLKIIDAKGNTVVDCEVTFDYPKTGPVDIYDLGVPRDARIIDKMPKEDYLAILDKYRECRDKATSEYIAIITHTLKYKEFFVSKVEVEYKSGPNYRFEQHFVFNAGESIEKYWPKHKKQLGDSYESLMAWLQRHYVNMGRFTIALYDGEYTYSVGRGNSGIWDKVKKRSFSSMPWINLQQLAWPNINTTEGHIIEDDYARENNLICIERSWQGRISDGKVSLPGRCHYYLDPEKDFICRRKVTERRPDAQWQKDKDWLKDVEPEKIRDRSIYAEEITEVIQAPNGCWYPRIIAEGIRKDYQDVPLKVSPTKTVYIRTNPEFPEDIFNADKLPGRSELN